MSEESIKEITSNIINIIREFENEDKYKIMFNIFVETLIQENAEKYLDKTIIGVYKDRLIEEFFDYKNISEVIDNLDYCAFEFMKEKIEKNPEYFIEIR